MNARNFFAGAALTGALISLGACGTDSADSQTEGQTEGADTTLGDVQKQATEAAGTAGEYINEQVQEVKSDMSAQLDKVNAKIDQLQARIDELEADARMQANETLSGLKSRRDEIASRIQEFQADSAEALDEVKSGLASAINEIEQSVDEALSTYQASGSAPDGASS